MSEPPLLTSNEDDEPGDLAQIHERYAPMLLSAFGALARQHNLIPGDRLEMLHDFYVEALGGVLERYDRSYGKFSTYLYGAFYFFARDRIARTLQWNDLIVPLDEEMDQAVVEDPHWEPSPEDERRLPQAVQQLPLELRLTLEARLAGESERCIASRKNVSRYAVRMVLAEALGRAAIAMDRAETIHPGHRALALRVWRDGVSLPELAVELGVTEREAGKRYRELLATLLGAVTALKGRCVTTKEGVE